MAASDSVHEVPKVRGAVPPGALWDDPAWRAVPAITLTHHMGAAPAYWPRTQAKLQYEAELLHVLFRVEDRYVRAVATAYQGEVWKDSCVEFFFTPGTDVSEGYFNIETNCGGTILFTHRQDRSTDVVPVSAADARTLAVFHTMPATVDPEITEHVTWQVGYRVPWQTLARYAPAAAPVPGAQWRANLYKIAETTSNPHSITWAPIDWPHPDFHRKEFFGVLEFGA
jgi:hypothetical protein